MARRRDIDRETAEILSALAEGYSHNVIIGEQLPHMTQAQINRRLMELVKNGKVVRKHRGIYDLAPGISVPKVEIDRPKSWTDKMNAFFSFRVA